MSIRYAIQDPRSKHNCFVADTLAAMSHADAKTGGFKVVTHEEAKRMGLFNGKGPLTSDLYAEMARDAAKTAASHAAAQKAQVRENERQRAETAAKREAAEREAYLATPQGRAALAAERAEAERIAYAESIMSLPEARDRPRTAQRLAFAHNAQSMPLAKAAVFLRGLPAEPAEQHSNVKGENTMADPTLKRRVEIALATSSHKADLGHEPSRKQANALSYALRLHETGTDLAAALKMSGADLAPFPL